MYLNKHLYKFFIEGNVGFSINIDSKASFFPNVSIGLPVFKKTNSVGSIVLDIPYLQVEFKDYNHTETDMYGNTTHNWFDSYYKVYPGLHFEYRYKMIFGKLGANLTETKHNTGTVKVFSILGGFGFLL